MNRFQTLAAAALGLLMMPAVAAGTIVITFDDPEPGFGSPSYSHSGATFTTSDVFNPVGPNPAQQLYIDGPHLEMIASLNDMVFVHFDVGAVNSISFGFVISTITPGPDAYAEFEVFDAAGVSLGLKVVLGDIFPLPGGGSSEFVEGLMELTFSGTVEYGVLRFTGGQRAAIDNFTFQIPAPGALAVFSLVGLIGRRRRR